MGKHEDGYPSRKWKKSKRVPFHTGNVTDAVEKKTSERIKKEEEERRKS